MIRRPVVVSPVKAILAMRGLVASGLPASSPKPLTMFKHPGREDVLHQFCQHQESTAASVRPASAPPHCRPPTRAPISIPPSESENSTE